MWELLPCHNVIMEQALLNSSKLANHSCGHYNDVIMGAMASQITSLTIVYSIVYLGADQRKHQSSASLAFVWGIHRRPMNSPHKWPVTRKMVPFDDVIMVNWFVKWKCIFANYNCNIYSSRPEWSNTLRSRRNGWHFADDIFKLILIWKACILIQISLNVFPKCPVNNNQGLV